MRRGVLGAVAVALLVGGCGQTDYATQVTSAGAHLNATVTTLNDQAPTTGWFEYWPTSAPSSSHETAHRNVTSTGPFSEGVGGLANHTEYRYRFCGSEGGSDPVCAQTRRFTTGRDTVQAYGESEVESFPTRSRWFTGLDFDMVAEPSGPSGSGVATEQFAGTPGDLQFDIGGPSSQTTVTCFNVSGNTAIIGFFRTDGEHSLTSFAQLVDGGPLGSGQDTVAGHINELPGVEQRDPSDCTTPLTFPLPLKAGEIVINDAP
jgi:hypothetical protein